MKSVTKDRLLEIISNIKRSRVAVLGDFVLDRFIYGRSTRISREAPVLILNEQRREDLPGCGANTLNNCLAYGVQAEAFSILGDDEAGLSLISQLKNNGLKDENSNFVQQKECPTTCKTRVLGGLRHSTPQQIVRIDTEKVLEFNKLDADLLLHKLSESLDSLDAIIVADYGLGVVSDYMIQQLQELIKRTGKKVVVDSRFSMLKFKGFCGITPNISEIEEALGIPAITSKDGVEKTGRQVLQELELQMLLVTQGKFGMTLIEPAEATHIPCFGSDEVTDVTGAGDTVIATFTAAIASGANMVEAAIISNIAGGLVVQKQGTATLTTAELTTAIKSWSTTQ